MSLPKKFKDIDVYDKVTLGVDWAPSVLSPLISNSVLTGDNILQRIDEKVAKKAMRIQKDPPFIKNSTFPQSKAIFTCQSITNCKNGDSRVKLEHLLEYEPDSAYKLYINEFEQLCRNLAFISLEKSRDNQIQLLLDYKKSFEKCRQFSKNIDALDARNMTFPSEVETEKQELLINSLNNNLLILFQKLLEDECKEWEKEITADFESIRTERLKKRSEALKEFYISSINKINQEKDRKMSLPTFYCDKIQNATPETCQVASLTEEEMFPLSYLQSSLKEVSPNYKALIESEVVNMYLLYLRENPSSRLS